MLQTKTCFGSLKRIVLRTRAAWIVALGVLLGAACTPASAPAPGAPGAPTQAPAAPRVVRFMAGYKPQANLPFVAAYVAQANGYFAEQGLQVEITHSSGQGEHLKLLLQGSVDVITAAADEVLERRADGLPVVSIAVLGQRNQRALAVRADSPIQSPRDWEGRLVGFKVEPAPEYLAMLAASGVDRSRIREVPVGFDPRLLATGTVDVYPVFESNEPDTLQRLGVPVRLFRPNDYGVPGLGLTFETRDSVVAESPDTLARFLKAALHGVEYARDHPDEATDIVMRYAPQEDRAHQRAMLDTELDMANGPVTATRGLGFTSPDQWQGLHDSLLKYGALSQAVDIKQASTDHFLDAVMRDGRVSWP
jgi:ABC-type nitrate/sulfonate/bicarbonate transport system substrate-binding protein